VKISELLVFEAIGTVGASTDPQQQNGLPKTGNNPNAQTQQQNTQTTQQANQQNTQTPATTPSQPVQGQPSQQGKPGQPMGQNPAQSQAQTAQQQQSLQASMTDLDKIAAQIVGLKQKQQDLQKQMQTPAV
jgi:hypothetical protein